MAQKTQVVLISDLTGDEIPDGKGQTINFSVDNVDYTIDLTDQEAKGFYKAIDMYRTHATKVSGRRSSGTRRSGSGSKRSSEELAQVREWAAAQGYEVSQRGRIKSEILQAYDEAH